MKRQIISFIAFVMMGMVTAFAQAPSSTLSYQSAVRNAQNQLVINQSVSVTVNIKCGGTLTYSEEHTGLQTNENGVLAFRIGNGTPATGTWADITWNNATIQTVTTWANGSVTSEDVPVTAVPFALQSGNIDASALATLAGDNTFTGTNTVPGSFDVHTTNSTTCGNIVANACDLYTVFDSLNRRVDNTNDTVLQISDQLADVRDSIMDAFALFVSQTGSGNLSRCGGSSVAVTYTATPNYGEVGEYTYSWSGSPTSKSNNAATYTYTSTGTHTVTVTATHTAHAFTLTATISTTVSNGTMVSISFSEDNGIVSVKSVSGNPNSISWGDGQTGTFASTSTSHDYTTTLSNGPHEVTITASNASGCSFSRTMTVAVLGSGSTMADRTAKPCTSASKNGHAVRTAGSGHGDDGKETANTNGDITSVKDYDGNEYPVVEIGSQCWMAVNLRTLHYVNGEAVEAGSQWDVDIHDTDPYYYDYSSLNIPLELRGYLYNWYAATNSTQLCPTGWHLPTDEEWNTLEREVSGSDWQASYETTNGYLRGSHAGKLSGSGYWILNQYVQENAPGDYASESRNESGFSAVAAGEFNINELDGQYEGWLGNEDYAHFWSSTECYDEYYGPWYDPVYGSWYRLWGYSRASVERGNNMRTSGESVRCVRD